jgi:hypothetical protein
MKGNVNFPHFSYLSLMKNIKPLSLIITIFVGTSTPSHAQWTPVYQDSHTLFYHGAFPTDNTGYVLASDTIGPLVLRTTDGGANWNKRYLLGAGSLSKIVMTDSLRGYVIKGGTPVRLLRTTNGFNTFSTHALDSAFTVEALCLINDSTGFYLNNGPKLRKFTNYGAAFSHVIDTLSGGQNLQFVNSTKGYLDTGGGLLSSTDAGTSWNVANANLGFFCVVFNFASPLNGYFSDVNDIFITHDGGMSFPQQYHFPNVYSFATNNNFCIAANDVGNVAYTYDSGSTWQTETTGINLIAPEPYTIVMSPGEHCFLFSQFSGEIRKKELPLTGVENID